MANEPLFMDIYSEIWTNDYCCICFRTCKERRLVDGKNLTKFKFFWQGYNLEVNENISKICNQNICYMCDAQAMAANRFFLAVNLSDHLHSLFNKMKKQPSFYSQVKDHLSNAGSLGELVYHRRNIEDLQIMLEQHRRNTNFLQTETLLLNNPGNNKCPEDPSSVTTTTTDRESLRDLITFESQPGIDDDTLFDLEVSNKQIIIEDDDPIKVEPPDQNVFIIPDKLPTVETNIGTDNCTGYLLHPILVQNGTLTIPSLDKKISINHPNNIVNGLDNNNSNNSQLASLNQYVVSPQTISKPQNVRNYLKQNTPHKNFMPNVNKLGKDVSLVKNPTSGQKNLNFLQNNSDFSKNAATIERHTIKMVQNSSNSRQKTITSSQRANIIQKMSSIIENSVINLPSLVPIQVAINEAMPVKVSAAPVKRPDSDSSADCQNIQPLRKPEGKIDWEDKIPMDVISFVSASDPTTMTAKRQKTTLTTTTGHLRIEGSDPMDKCVITDVKSVRDTDYIDLC